MLTGLNFVMIHVKDIAAARAFYTEKFGLSVMVEGPEFLQFAQPGGQGASFAIGVSESAVPISEGTELWWYVDDADATHADLVAKGVKIVATPHDEPFGRAFSIKDSAGNTIYLLQPHQ